MAASRRTLRRSKDVDAYVAAQPVKARKALQRVRTLFSAVFDDGEETISYRIPAIKCGRRIAFYFAAWAEHYAIYPATAAVRDAHGDALREHLQGKGTIAFSYDAPVPSGLITAIAKTRAAELAQGRKASPAKKPRRAPRR